MNVSGALKLDVEPTTGFTVDVTKPKDIKVHGNYEKGFFIRFKDAGIERGPYPDPALALKMAEYYVGMFERAT